MFKKSFKKVNSTKHIKINKLLQKIIHQIKLKIEAENKSNLAKQISM